MLTTFRDDLKPFEELARSFAAKELARKVEEHDRYPFGDFFSDVLDRAYEVGFLGVMLPADLGGTGGDIATLCVILEKICRADSSLGGIIFTNALAQEIMLASGASEEAKEIFTSASRAQEFLVAFPSYSDPDAMDDLPLAAASGNGYVLTGRLEFLVLGGLAPRALVPARMEGRPGWSFFLADLAQPGAELSAPIFSLGLHACPASDLVLKGAKARLIGGEGKGGEVFGRVSKMMHLAAAAMNAGIMKGSYQEALAYSRERLQGGREIINWSEVAMLLAGMNVKSEVADLCVTQACLAAGKDAAGNGRSAVAAALHIHELACEAVTDGIQVLGGNGYMKDYGQEKRYRDARQVQALLGSAPLRKIALMREAAGLIDTRS